MVGASALSKHADTLLGAYFFPMFRGLRLGGLKKGYVVVSYRAAVQMITNACPGPLGVRGAAPLRWEGCVRGGGSAAACVALERASVRKIRWFLNCWNACLY